MKRKILLRASEQRTVVSRVYRADVDLSGTNKEYGHWWIEIGPEESYGWWPADQVDLGETLFGTDGELNARYAGGTATKDPDHGVRGAGVKEFDVYAKNGVSVETVKGQIRDFAQNYKGSWSWPIGQNCHSFQNDLLNTLDLRIKPVPEKVEFTGTIPIQSNRP